MNNEKTRIAKFETLSEGAYNKIVSKYQEDTFVAYSDIKIPDRATSGSAGYDFYLTRDIELHPGESCVVDTFIRCKIDESWGLFLFPKSGLGFKFHMGLANTIGVVDSDYYYTVSDDDSNEGHIMIKIVNNGIKHLTLEKGKKFCQGIFMPYGITVDDPCNQNIRCGGFGSTESESK